MKVVRYSQGRRGIHKKGWGRPAADLRPWEGHVHFDGISRKDFTSLGFLENGVISQKPFIFLLDFIFRQDKNGNFYVIKRLAPTSYPE